MATITFPSYNLQDKAEWPGPDKPTPNPSPELPPVNPTPVPPVTEPQPNPNPTTDPKPTSPEAKIVGTKKLWSHIFANGFYIK